MLENKLISINNATSSFKVCHMKKTQAFGIAALIILTALIAGYQLSSVET
jgi:hypothetical protein